MVKGKKHMSPVDRAEIEAGLRMGKSINLIARETGRSTSTVSREVAKHTYASDKGTQLRPNQCVHRQDCRVTGLCGNPQCRGVRCAVCGLNRCNALCGRCERIGCGKRPARPGKVCNGCPEENRCHVRKHFYIANRAQEDYRALLSGARQGAGIPEGERERLDAIITPAIKAGQSMHHICVSRPGAFNQNERTLSRYLHHGMFSAKRGDMKRSCMVRQRKPRSGDRAHKVEQGCYAGRDYRAYQAYCREHPEKSVVFMDLVIGRTGGKCLMTLHWPAAAFMIAVLIPGKCAENVAAAFDGLYKALGHELFSRLFAVVLTDRGSEFSNPSRIERTGKGVERCRVFFCDPMNSNQKSQLERNHELVREVLPKGVSFDGLTQGQADLMMSHVNAYVRLSQSDRTPYDVFEFIHGGGTAAKLHIERIDPKEVVLKPRLVGIELK